MITGSIKHMINQEYDHRSIKHMIKQAYDHRINQAHDQSRIWSQGQSSTWSIKHMINQAHDQSSTSLINLLYIVLLIRTWLHGYMVTWLHGYMVTWSSKHMIIQLTKIINKSHEQIMTSSTEDMIIIFRSIIDMSDTFNDQLLPC